MTLWEFLGCWDERERQQAARDLARNQCPYAGRCSTITDCVECWAKAIDSVEEVKLRNDPR